MLELILFGISALVGSGVLFAHKRMLTYIGFAGALFEAQMLLTTYIARTYIPGSNRQTIFLVAGIVFLAIWASQYKKWTSPYATPGSGTRDMYVGIVMLIIIAAAYPIVSSNGYVGENFILHGFYNGDVVTFASLIQKSFDTAGLVSQNPFSANGYLEYPTLLHGAFADFFSLLGIGKDWLYYLGTMTYVGIFLTVPLFFLVWDTVWPEPANEAEKWFGVSSRRYVYALQALITLIAIALSIDSFVYPQSHFFLQGLELTLIALFANTAVLPSRQQHVPVVTGAAIAVLLLFSNSVTGTVAAALAGILCLVRIFDKKRSIHERILFLALGVGVALLMRGAADGKTSFTTIHFSVSSASEMMRAGLPAIFVLVSALFSLSRKQYLSIASLLVAACSFAVFLLSNRAIVTENASRFLYHSFLIGFPLLLPFCIRGVYLLRRELWLTSRPLSERIAGYVGLLCIVGIALLPIGVSLASTYKSLVISEPSVISFSTRTALWWLDEHASTTDIVATSGKEPYSVPLFTGRAVLRLEDYWLSEQDDVLEEVQAAFTGDTKNQQHLISRAQYVIVPKTDANLWAASKLKSVFETPNEVIYETR